MKSSSNRSLVRTGARIAGECAVRVPVASRVVSQLLDPTTPAWRRAMLLVVLAEAALSMYESVQQPTSVRRVRSSS